MSELSRLIEEAKAAIAEGNLELAETLTAQIKALKTVLDLEPPKVDPEPATNKQPVVVEVVEDEADKAQKRYPWQSFGEFLMAVKNAEHGHMDQRMPALREADGFSINGALGDEFVGSFAAARDGIKSYKAAPSGVGESLPQTGGVLVGSDRMTSILSRVYESGQLLSRVSMDTVGPNSNGMTYYAEAETDRGTGNRRGGVRFYWAAENSAITTSAPTFRKMELKLKKAAAAVYVTEEQLQDTSALESYVMRILPEEIRWGVEDSILNGTGVGQPLGILNANCAVSVAKETGQTAATVVYENLVKMWAAGWARSQTNFIWLHSQDVLPQLMLMSLDVGTGGMPVYLPPGGASAAPYGTLFGRPAFVHESATTVGSVGDIWLVDPSQYQMIEKGGIRSASSIHVRFLNDETTYKFVYRVDGQPMWNSTLTPANDGQAVSPFVNIAVRA